MKHLALILISSVFLTACTSAMDRIDKIGQAPALAPIEDPTIQKGYQPVSLPMPTPEIIKKQPNSLWASHRKGFFKDQRASEIGDILTVVINIEDEAALENASERTRQSEENAGLDGFLGFETNLSEILPEGITPGSLIDTDADSTFNGEGSIEREEEIDLQLAALITQILPNGNLVIYGKQEVRVNFEKRIIAIDGVIRPEDISIDNTINANQIAEARIAYGGEGHITDVMQPRYGQQLYDVIFPF